MTLTLIANDEFLEQSDVTPSDLKAIRLRLGLDMAELAQLLGLAGRRDIVENLERGRTWTLHQGHIDVMRALEDVFDAVAQDVLEQEAPDFLITFPNDGVFADREPALYERLRFNSVHRMLMARVQAGFSEYDDTGRKLLWSPTIAELVPSRYDEWLRGRMDTPENRQSWAEDHVSVFRVKEGLPIVGRPES